MKKYIFISFLVFAILMVTSLTVYVNVNFRDRFESEENIEVDNQNAFDKEELNLLKEQLLLLGKWEDITEEDKITFAFGSESKIIERVTNSLKSNNCVVCYVVGGRFDKENKGSYFVMTGFDNSGKVRILSPENNYEEKYYIYERIFENVEKILFFDNTEGSDNA